MFSSATASDSSIMPRLRQIPYSMHGQNGSSVPIGPWSPLRAENQKSKKNVGSNNPQYGTMWITNGEQNKKITKDVDPIPEGWYKGRKSIQPVAQRESVGSGT